MQRRSSLLRGFLPVLAIVAAGCGSQAVTPGTPRSVARAAAAAYTAAGHRCDIQQSLVYCDMTGSDLPLLMGYDQKDQELMFATVYDTQAAFGLACPAIPADQIVHPAWMLLKCDEVEFKDKTKKTVLSVIGGGHVPDQGLSRAELNRSAGLFMREAETYIARLSSALAQAQVRQTRAAPGPSPVGETNL